MKTTWIAPRVDPGQTAQAPASTARRRPPMLAEMMTPDRNSFGVMRLLLALAVVVSHGVYLTTGKAELEPLYAWTGYTLGQHGVQGFFILSGILVAQSLCRSSNPVDFAAARILRIFPALIVCVLLTALGLGVWLSTLPPGLYLKDAGVLAYIAKTISLWSGSAQLPGVFQDNVVPRAVNTSVWTLKYEVLCYLILGIVGFAVLQLRMWRAAAVAAGLVWLAVVLAKPVGIELHAGDKGALDVLRYFMLFFGTGVLFYAVRDWLPVHGLGLLPLGALAWVSIGGRFDEAAFALFIGYLILWAATFRFGGMREATNESDYSYATYLYHYPVSQAVIALMPGIGLLSLLTMTMGVTLLLAFLSWELIERPALRLRHRLRLPIQPSPEAAPQAVEPENDPQPALPARPAVLSTPRAARVWRPAETVRRIEVADAPVADTVETEPPRVSASRLAFATQKIRAGRLQRGDAPEPITVESAAAARAAARAAVVVEEEPQMVRVFESRHAWGRPIKDQPA